MQDLRHFCMQDQAGTLVLVKCVCGHVFPWSFVLVAPHTKTLLNSDCWLYLQWTYMCNRRKSFCHIWCSFLNKSEILCEWNVLLIIFGVFFQDFQWDSPNFLCMLVCSSIQIEATASCFISPLKSYVWVRAARIGCESYPSITDNWYRSEISHLRWWVSSYVRRHGFSSRMEIAVRMWESLK